MCLFSPLLFYSQTIKPFLQNRRNSWERPSNLPRMPLWRRTASPCLPLVQSRWEHPQACDWAIQYVTIGPSYRVQDLQLLSTSSLKHGVSYRVVKTRPPLLMVSLTKSCFRLFRSIDTDAGRFFYLFLLKLGGMLKTCLCHHFKLLKWEKCLCHYTSLPLKFVAILCSEVVK